MEASDEYIRVIGLPQCLPDRVFRLCADYLINRLHTQFIFTLLITLNSSQIGRRRLVQLRRPRQIIRSSHKSFRFSGHFI